MYVVRPVAPPPRPSVAVVLSPPPTQPPQQVGTHTVQSGETLSGIAQRYRIDMAQLARMNGIAAPYNIRAGQRLILPGALAPAATATSQVAEIISRSTAAPLQAPQMTAYAPLAQAPQRTAAPTAALPTPPARSSGGFAWPVRGEVVSTFGSKGGGVANDGIDIRAAAGLPVLAVDNGVVAYAGSELKALGNLVLIQHAGGWVSASANAGSILVRRGDTVSRGQAVATTGQTGNAKVPGLHFELRRGTVAVDPLQYLGAVAVGELAPSQAPLTPRQS